MSKNGECLTTFAETSPTSLDPVVNVPAHLRKSSFFSPQWITVFSYTVDDIMHVYL